MSNKKILSPYLNLNRLKNPKDDFKNCIKVLKKKTTLSEKKIIDIGCANGEFLDYFISKHPKNTYVGVDISPSFLKIAKKNKKLKDVKFIKNNFKNIKIKPTFDIAICMGVSHSIKNINELINKLSSFVKKKGIVIIDGFFNDYDVDTQIFFKDHSSINTKWQNDFNHFSKKSIIGFLKKKKIKNFSFHESILKVNIPKNHKNKPHHFVWTERIATKKIVTNGTNVILKRQFLLFIN
jgi:ubiquinone/menaquinone biosynthesis C-methylase UbiE